MANEARGGAAGAQAARPSLLVVDDDPLITDTLAFALGTHYEVLTADSRSQAVERVRQRLVEQGLEAALVPARSSRVYQRKLDGSQEARLIALACSKPPAGKRRWTLRLLADQAVELEITDTLSHETVRQTLKKTNCGLT